MQLSYCKDLKSQYVLKLFALVYTVDLVIVIEV